MKIPPPEGITEEDYEAIEAAVVETVRGRWFLNEFARRSRADEMGQMLDAMARLEQVVTEQRVQPADPSIRLLVQRLKEVAQQLDGLAAQMRVAGQDEGFCARIEAQARAVSGVLRLNGPAAPTPAPIARETEPIPAPPRVLPAETEAQLRLAPVLPPVAATPAALPADDRPRMPERPQDSSQDARLAALARLDALPLSEKLALFN